MAQANPEPKPQESPEKEIIKTANASATPHNFKFNAHAPEFVPRSHSTTTATTTTTTTTTQMPISGYFYPCVQFIDGSATVVGTDWFYLNNDRDPFHIFPNSLSSLPNSSRNVLTEDVQQKVVKQVEYLFSDLSLMANDTMAKHVSKDPEGYVPISVVASMKKIKALVTDHNLLVQALRSSTKLVLSKDCKKVKRRNPFTESYIDELQCRTVVVENLPEDHSYQNLEKIFSVVGTVKAIRLCHPQEANASRAKNEVIITNKLHALVEYENAEIAEKAAERLNDENNWRKGMRVRVMLRCSPKSVLKGRKMDFDALTDDEECPSTDLPEETSQANGVESITEGEEGPAASRKASIRGRGKTKGGRVQTHTTGRGLLSSPTHSNPSSVLQCDVLGKQSTSSKGPRMPDGTRGFTLGRGKPLISSSTPTSV